jgi:hypothetical protein
MRRGKAGSTARVCSGSPEAIFVKHHAASKSWKTRQRIQLCINTLKHNPQSKIITEIITSTHKKQKQNLKI